MNRNHAIRIRDLMECEVSFIAYSAGNSFGILCTGKQEIKTTMWKCADGQKFNSESAANYHALELSRRGRFPMTPPKSVVKTKVIQPSEAMKKKWRKLVEQERKHSWGNPVYLIEFDGVNLTLEGGLTEEDLEEACRR